jgi:hypothetical protein
MTSTRHTHRLLGAAVAATALTASLLAAAPSAGAAVHPLTSQGVQNAQTPVVYNGTDLVTAQVTPGGALYAYEQVPGAASWKKQLVASSAPIGGAPLEPPSITATSDSVQIVSADSAGNIWFFQQLDGLKTWGWEEVGSVTLGNPDGTQVPQIAWTGVPGHTGTNSVITVANGAGDILMWYQNGGSWSQETVWNELAGDDYYGAAVTATDKGIVIVAPSTNGSFQSFYQPYGPNPWQFDGSLGDKSGPGFSSVSVTWDGTNVDAAASYDSGGSLLPNTLLFMWKSDSATTWSDEAVTGITSSHPLADPPAITFTGDNLLLTAVQLMSTTKLQLDSWWQGSTFTNFNYEPVTTVVSPKGFGPSDFVYTEGASAPETVIVLPFTTNHYSTNGLEDWTDPLGGQTWTKDTVSAP